jgi:hypothetical protein
MYVLVLIVMVNSSISVTTTNFKSSATCLSAINSALQLESSSIAIKARCVSK